MHITLQEGDVSQSRKNGGSSSRLGPQPHAACDVEGNIVEFSTEEEDDEGEDSEDDFDDTPSLSQLGTRGKS